ncbi:MAG: hypothetical protein ACREN8_09870 [Candidatus Dormibacteraceae bacterium]
MAQFGLHSTVREVVEGFPQGRDLLYEHGYEVGEAFIDGLSQCQSLQFAARSGRLRDLEGLLQQLNGGVHV